METVSPLAQEKMKNKFLVSINNLLDLAKYKKVGITTFLFPLQDYCVGYPYEFNIEEINKLKNIHKYVLINRLLDCHDIDNLKEILPKLNIQGLIFEDIGIFNLAKKLNLNYELIHFPNHFNTNYESINTFLDRGLTSVVVSNELTKEELKEITKKSIKPLILHAFGYNQAMYSRRLLLDNYAKYYNIPKTNPLIINEDISKHEFLVYENKYGTILYDNNLFNGRDLLYLDNILYFLINTSFIATDTVIKFLNNEYEEPYNGFLDRETIFKLRG